MPAALSLKVLLRAGVLCDHFPKNRPGGSVPFFVVGVIFIISVMTLLVFGIPFVLQSPLRTRGVRCHATVARKSIPKDGKIDVVFAYVTADRKRFTITRFGLSYVPEGAGVIYDPMNPGRSDFVDAVPRNPRRRRIFLIVTAGVAVIALALLCAGLLV
ncbi:hypothetical protein AB0I93_12185 [Streptomyces sp. NPDC049967]|uniref:hypothetical protein n=1 Tax=unclassified Streptomyces TaxID=2593676 RepID=UPI002E288A27|nr:hypothetical protein [Streptomyces sp. NBC_00342]